MTEFSLDTLEAIILERLKAGGEPSYTRSLAEKGIDKCAEKFGEEAVEAIIASVRREPAALTCEAADVLYHLLVLLAVSGVPLRDVVEELDRRTAQSGLEEKRARARS